MKYLSFVVPSYNAEKYLKTCVTSLLVGGEDVEIIIVNDGSKDHTLQIAQEFASQYPSIVKVIDKPNGGHGSTINAALKVATGIYFKCVDADDWVNKEAYLEILSVMKKHYAANSLPDMYAANFVYENLTEKKQWVDTHKNRFPVGEICTFDDLKKFGPGEFLMMHNIIHKLSVLKQTNINLPEHTFYIDNLYIYLPMFYTKTMCYLDVDFYRYYVGRPNQSVTFENMTKNYKMQLTVMKEMSLRYSYDELKTLSKKHRDAMIHELVIISYLTLFYIAADFNKERKQEYKAYLNEFKYKNKKLYSKIRYRTTFALPFLLIPPLRRFVVMEGYKRICNKTHWN